MPSFGANLGTVAVFDKLTVTEIVLTSPVAAGQAILGAFSIDGSFLEGGFLITNFTVTDPSGTDYVQDIFFQPGVHWFWVTVDPDYGLYMVLFHGKAKGDLAVGQKITLTHHKSSDGSPPVDVNFARIAGAVSFSGIKGDAPFACFNKKTVQASSVCLPPNYANSGVFDHRFGNTNYDGCIHSSDQPIKFTYPGAISPGPLGFGVIFSALTWAGSGGFDDTGGYDTGFTTYDCGQAGTGIRGTVDPAASPSNYPYYYQSRSRRLVIGWKFITDSSQFHVSDCFHGNLTGEGGQPVELLSGVRWIGNSLLVPSFSEELDAVMDEQRTRKWVFWVNGGTLTLSGWLLAAGGRWSHDADHVIGAGGSPSLWRLSDESLSLAYATDTGVKHSLWSQALGEVNVQNVGSGEKVSHTLDGYSRTIFAVYDNSWKVIVGLRQSDGTLVFSTPVSMGLTNASDVKGSLEAMPDGSLEFTFTKNDGSNWIARCRSLSNAGAGAWL